ncbi:hypothetical protein ACGFSB_19925 [Streptomyces sp. NPDC048441]|uniref:hypothetical protein n=1 Tax=Streptomyces sp. NPDC048441 TaxID=3365552 RepID=UPI00370FD58C
MTNGERQRRGTPRSHLGDHLRLIAQFNEQARRGLKKDSDDAHVFMAVYSGFLIEAGAQLRSQLDPSLAEQATVAIRRRAPTATRMERDLATRLLATLWAAGQTAGIDTADWIRAAPELPDICLRAAALVTEDSDGGTPPP